jgi:hypothetical protein
VRRRDSPQSKATCDRGSRLAALVGAVLIFKAGRRLGSHTNPPAAQPPAAPTPPKRTKLGDLAHWFTWPIRVEDQEKRRLEENPPPPAPPKETCKKRLGCLTVSCGDEEADAADDKEEDKEEDAEGGLTGIVVKVLGAIAAGVGVTGAVVVVGATIFWARFEAAGVPAVQAVTAIPRTELLVQGGQEMVIFVLIALAATLLIALADPRGIITRGTLFVLAGLVGGALVYPMLFTAMPWWSVLLLTLGALFLALAAIGIGFATKQKLLPLLVSVFIATFFISASGAFLIVQTQHYAQAIAIQFGPKAGKEKGLTGIYVTATEKTIFFARPDQDTEGATGLYEVPRAENTTYAVGPLEPIEKDDLKPVEERGAALLARLKADAESFPPPEAKTSEAKEEAEATAGQ